MFPDVTHSDLKIGWVHDKPIAVLSPLFREFSSCLAQGIIVEANPFYFDESCYNYPTDEKLLPYTFSFEITDMPETASRRSINASCRLYPLHEPPHGRGWWTAIIRYQGRTI